MKKFWDALRRRLSWTIVGCSLLLLGLVLNHWVVPIMWGGYWDRLAYGRIWLWQLLLFVLGSTSLLLARRRRSVWWRRASDVSLIITFTCLALIGVETAVYAVARVKNHWRPGSVGFLTRRPRYRFYDADGNKLPAPFMMDSTLGYRLRPNLRVTVERVLITGERLAPVRYTTDADGWRVTPLAQSTPRSEFILFFTDSFCMGEGVDDEATWPAQVGALAPQWQPYNFGVSAYGPQQMMLQLANGTVRRRVKETHGRLIYLYIPAHLARVFGTMRMYQRTPLPYPFYRLDEAGQLRPYDLFGTLEGKFYAMLGNSYIVAATDVDLPRLGDPAKQATVAVIAAARDEFKKQFQSDEFYVLLYPGNIKVGDIRPQLQAAGIKYLDYSDLLNPQAPENHLPLDAHPTPLAYRRIAEKLVADLSSLAK